MTLEFKNTEMTDCVYGIGNQNLQTVLPENLKVHQEIVGDLERFRNAAQKAGFLLRLESAYRSFDRQLTIWNNKASGKTPLLDAKSQVITDKTLFRKENEGKLWRTILYWSALPGMSRHHFGTDIDISDASQIPDGYEVELTTAECESIFKPFHDWISEREQSDSLFGFRRVFIPGCGKVQPEKWHLSHIPTAKKMQRLFSVNRLRSIYEQTSIFCKNEILNHLDEIVENYVFPYFIQD